MTTLNVANPIIDPIRNAIDGNKLLGVDVSALSTLNNTNLINWMQQSQDPDHRKLAGYFIKASDASSRLDKEVSKLYEKGADYINGNSTPQSFIVKSLIDARDTNPDVKDAFQYVIDRLAEAYLDEMQVRQESKNNPTFKSDAEVKAYAQGVVNDTLFYAPTSLKGKFSQAQMHNVIDYLYENAKSPVPASDPLDNYNPNIDYSSPNEHERQR
jgi:hypothetical protein